MKQDFCESHLNTPLHRIFKSWLEFCTFNYIDPIISGLENIPSQGGAIIVSNHADVSDGVYIGLASPRPIRFLVAKQLADIPVFGKLVPWLGNITVTRDGGLSDIRALEEAVESLNRGLLIGIFPEGRVNFGSDLLPFKSGAARMALESGKPIIPVGIFGSEKILGTSRVARYGKISIHFGKPITFNKKLEKPSKEDIAEALRVIRSSIVIAHTEAKNNFSKVLKLTITKLTKRVLASLFLAPFTFTVKSLANPLFAESSRKPAL